MKRMIRIVVWCLIIFSVTQVLAQSADCPTIVQTALEATDQACSSIGRNQACYGNLNLQAIPQSGVSELNFSKPGDLVDVGSVQSLDLSPLDPEGQTWGVALMKLQANIPDTLPGQNVTFLLFGNVEIDNAVPSGAAEAASGGGTTLPAIVSGMTMLVELSAASVPQQLSNGTALTLDGYDNTTQMVHAQLEDGSSGWTPTQTLKITGDVNTLPAMSMTESIMQAALPAAPSDTPTASPMQAFYFKTGANDAPCTEAPDSGILIQTPEGAGKIMLTMNGVDVQLGSTAYVQASTIENTTSLTVNVVEGEGIVKSQGVSKVVPAGTRVHVPLREEDNHLVADGTPGDVEAYDNTALAALPVSHLEREITVATALTVDEIAALSGDAIEVVGGKWQVTYSAMTASGTCPEGIEMALSGANNAMRNVELTIPAGAFNPEKVVDETGEGIPSGTTIVNSTPNDFIMNFSGDGGDVVYEIHVISPTHIDMLTVTTIEGGCALTIPGSMEPVG